MGIESESKPEIPPEDEEFEKKKKEILKETGGKEVGPGEKGSTAKHKEDFEEEQKKEWEEAHPEEQEE